MPEVRNQRKRDVIRQGIQKIVGRPPRTNSPFPRDESPMIEMAILGRSPSGVGEKYPSVKKECSKIEEFVQIEENSFENCHIYIANQIKSTTGSEFLKKIGEGGFGTVYECRLATSEIMSDESLEKEKETGYYKIALKKFKEHGIQFGQEKSKEHSKLKRESRFVNRLSHKNIVFMFGVCKESPFCGMIFELCEGSSLKNVYTRLLPDFPLPLSTLVDWAKQICEGMDYLVKEQFLHRDLKADNILVKQAVCFCATQEALQAEVCGDCGRRSLNRLQLKITDFGLTRSMTSVGNSCVGTWSYMAPEVFKCSTRWRESADVWSFGTVLWEIMARELPSKVLGEGAHAALQNRDGQKLKPQPEWPDIWNEIMLQCWIMEPENRPTFQRLLEIFENYSREIEANPTLNMKINKTKMELRTDRVDLETDTNPRDSGDYEEIVSLIQNEDCEAGYNLEQSMKATTRSSYCFWQTFIIFIGIMIITMFMVFLFVKISE